jgi:hypothetical protein
VHQRVDLIGLGAPVGCLHHVLSALVNVPQRARGTISVRYRVGLPAEPMKPSLRASAARLRVDRHDYLFAH